MQLEDNLTISTYWIERPLNGEGYLNWTLGFLENLRQFSSLFSNLYMVRTKTSDSPIFRGEQQELFKLLIESLPEELAYQNVDPQDKKFSLSAHCGLGFSHAFITTLEKESHGCLIEIRIGKSSPGLSNSVVLTISKGLLDEEKVVELFEHVVSYICPDFAALSCEEIDDLLDQQPSEKRMGWLTYLKGEVSEFPGGLPFSKFAEGGIIRSADHLPCASKKEEIALHLNAYRVLKEAGLLKK